MEILGALENQEAILNGVTGMGKGYRDIPGSIVSVETAPSQQNNTTDLKAIPVANDANVTNAVISHVASNAVNSMEPITNQPKMSNVGTSIDSDLQNMPCIIWVIGGPGSNKATLCLKAVSMNPGWGHIRYV